MVTKIVAIWIGLIIICLSMAIFCAFPLQITCMVILSWWIAKQIKKHNTNINE